MWNKLLTAFVPTKKAQADDAITTNNVGEWAEQQARDFLLKKKLLLRECNYRCKAGEIDLIMTDKETLVFVEVRSRHNPRFGSALDSVTSQKQQRIIRAANHYLQKYRLLDKMPCRFDVVSVRRGSDIEWVPNAFMAHG